MSVPTNLYRSVKKRSIGSRLASDEERAATFVDNEGKKSLYPDYVGFTRGDGSVRPPDVTTYTQGGETWIRGVTDRGTDGRFLVGRNQGVSLSEESGGFGYGSWCYFFLPESTDIPASLDIIHTPTRRDDGHYSLRCRNAMRQDAYQGALDTLARAAIDKAVELGVPSLKFSET
jgi:hypothetical protein